MQSDRFHQLTVDIATASPTQILQLQETLERIITEQSTVMALARRTCAIDQTRCCPHCKSDNIVSHGKDQNQRQRFKCRACRRTYNILTGTPMARARKSEKWSLYLGYMTEHHSVRTIRRSGIGLNHVTIWRWRHRFLEAAAIEQAKVLRGVIEVDETVFSRSFKGSRGLKIKPPSEALPPRVQASDAIRSDDDEITVLTALDSGGGVVQAMPSLIDEIEIALAHRIAPGSVLCAPNRTVYARVADAAGAEPHLISVVRNGADGNTRPSDSQRSGCHVRLGLRRVHHHHGQLRYLVNGRCRGVATKYLWQYLGWHRAMMQSAFVGSTLQLWALALPVPHAM